MQFQYRPSSTLVTNIDTLQPPPLTHCPPLDHQVDTCCRALSERLGKETYFFGSQPTPLDALVYGHLYTIITTPLQDTRLASIVNGYSNLVRLTNHVDAEYFKGIEIIG